jgi:hypothetical protein
MSVRTKHLRWDSLVAKSNETVLLPATKWSSLDGLMSIRCTFEVAGATGDGGSPAAYATAQPYFQVTNNPLTGPETVLSATEWVFESASSSTSPTTFHNSTTWVSLFDTYPQQWSRSFIRYGWKVVAPTSGGPFGVRIRGRFIEWYD